MSVSLQKGQKVNLSKEHAGLAKVIVGLGWDEAKPSGGGGLFGALFGSSSHQAIDCDASAIMLKNGKFTDKTDLVYFGNLKHKSGTVNHMGDNLTGAGEGDDEQIVISTNRGEPLVGTNCLAGKTYSNICHRIMGEEVPFLNLNEKQGVLEKLKDIFKKN